MDETATVLDREIYGGCARTYCPLICQRIPSDIAVVEPSSGDVDSHLA